MGFFYRIQKAGADDTAASIDNQHMGGTALFYLLPDGFFCIFSEYYPGRCIKFKIVRHFLILLPEFTESILTDSFVFE